MSIQASVGLRNHAWIYIVLMVYSNFYSVYYNGVGFFCLQAALKEERREARRVKKEMKELYRSEAQRAQKVAAVACPSSIHLM